MSAAEKLALLEEAGRIRSRLFGSDFVTVQERQLLVARLAEVDSQLNPEEQPKERTLPQEIAKLTPAEAEAKAKAILERPEYFRPHDLDPKTGARVITPEQHAALVQERADLIQRASEAERA